MNLMDSFLNFEEKNLNAITDFSNISSQFTRRVLGIRNQGLNEIYIYFGIKDTFKNLKIKHLAFFGEFP